MIFEKCKQLAAQIKIFDSIDIAIHNYSNCMSKNSHEVAACPLPDNKQPLTPTTSCRCDGHSDL